MMPTLALDNLERMNLWLAKINHTVTAWAAISLAVDAGVCFGSMSFES